MPYIKRQARSDIDNLMNPLIDCLLALPLEEQDGALNYTATRMFTSIYPRRYFRLNRALGVMSAITQELYRMVIAPYEDEKIGENGPVSPR